MAWKLSHYKSFRWALHRRNVLCMHNKLHSCVFIFLHLQSAAVHDANGKKTMQTDKHALRGIRYWNVIFIFVSCICRANTFPCSSTFFQDEKKEMNKRTKHFSSKSMSEIDQILPPIHGECR